MKTIELTDQQYEAIIARHGSIAKFLEQSIEVDATAANGEARSFYDAASRDGGLLRGGSEYSADLSSNSAHLEGFGQ